VGSLRAGKRIDLFGGKGTGELHEVADDIMGGPRELKERRVRLLIFLILLACYAYLPPPWADWNQNSRPNLVMAVVDRGTLYVDGHLDSFTATGDYAASEGHHYSANAPGSAFLGIPSLLDLPAAPGGEDFATAILMSCNLDKPF